MKVEQKKVKLASVLPPQPVKTSDNEADIGPALSLASSKTRAPMTREEYEKQQNTLSRIIDPETGRSRYECFICFQ